MFFPSVRRSLVDQSIDLSRSIFLIKIYADLDSDAVPNCPDDWNLRQTEATGK
jgi:hypothetical protein